MTGYQEGNEKMSASSITFLLANATITATLPGFATYLGIAQTTLNQIQTAKVLQEADKKGTTVSKKELRAALIALAVDIDRRVVAYATNVNNSGLLELVNYSESDLKRSTDSNLISICQVIRDNANANVSALATYGVTAAILTTLQTSINNFNASLPKGRVGTTNSEEATHTLTTLFKTLTANWGKIDTLVEMVRTSQPAFYNEYHNVRKVIVTGNGSLVLKVRAINALSGNPEANVTVTLLAENGQSKMASTNTKKSKVKKTAVGGGLNYKNTPEGTYLLTAKKPGFKDVTLTVNIVNGEMTVIDLNMEKQ